MPIPIEYNLRNVVQRPVSAVSTALGVALTVAILIAALALAAGFRAALVSTGSDENVIVLRKGADSELSSGVTREAANIIRANPEVATASDGRPLASAEVMVVTNKPRLGQPGNSNLTIRGVDPEALSFRSRVRIEEGRMFAPGAAEIVVGRRIAPRFADCRIGDRMRFGQRDFTVVGIFSAGGSSLESEVWGDNATLMPVLRGDVFQSLTFRMRHPERFDALKKELEADPRLYVQLQREREFYDSQSELLATAIRVAGVLIVLIMAVGAVFGAMNTMFAAVAHRTREVATLMVLGFSPWSVMVTFVLESVLLSLVGGLLGCLIALPINGIVTSTTNWVSFAETAFSLRVTPEAMGVGLVFAVVMGLVGGFLPALQAAKQPLATTLRGA